MEPVSIYSPKQAFDMPSGIAPEEGFRGGILNTSTGQVFQRLSEAITPRVMTALADLAVAEEALRVAAVANPAAAEYWAMAPDDIEARLAGAKTAAERAQLAEALELKQSLLDAEAAYQEAVS